MTKANGWWKWTAAVLATVAVSGAGWSFGRLDSVLSAHESQDGHPVIVERVASMLKVQTDMQVEQTLMTKDVAEIMGDIKLLLERTEGDRP